jgi:hypothetical protein
MISRLTTPNVLRRTIVIVFVLLAGALYVVIGKNQNKDREPFYQKNVKDLTTQRSIEFTRHCASCYNPAALKLRRSLEINGACAISPLHAHLSGLCAPIANEFLRIHPEMSNESVPFHVHNLDR